MPKPLKLRIYRAITTTLQSCRSKDPSNLPRNPIPSSARSHQRPSFNHDAATSAAPQPPQQHYTFQTQPKFHVITATPTPPPPKRRRRRTKKRTAHRLPPRVRLESSWPHSFTSEEESEALVGSSTDDDAPRLRRRKIRPGCSEARLSVFKKLIPCTVDGKVKESFAVVKKSRDPYEDFKSSMMDMVLEKHMFHETELEQLLQCFLSLNSTRYHEVILQAFYATCEAVFQTTI